MMSSARVRIAAAVATIALVATTAAPAFALTAVHLKISGSTTLYPLAFKWSQVYKSASSGSSITVVGGGSGKGIGDVNAGNVAIGMSSRMKATNGSDGAAVFTAVARDALVVVVNAKFQKAYPNYIYRMSPTQVQQIFRGQITNWKQINSHLPSHSINLVGRTGSSGTYTYFKQMFLTDGTADGLIGHTTYKQSSRTKQFASNGMVRSTVAGDMYAIGYLSEAFVDKTVKPLNMPRPAHWYDSDYVVHNTPSQYVGQWVAPSSTAALKNAGSASGAYVYVRPLYFVTAHAPSGDALTFINWCKGAGQAYVTGQHFLKMD